MDEELKVESLPKRPKQDLLSSQKTVAVPLVTTAKNAGGVQMVNCANVAKSTQMDLVEMARQIQMADEFTKANASSKLTVIAEQVRFLQGQAQRVLEEATLNAELHHIACNFRKVPGNIYYLYQRSNGQKYFSLLAPDEWGTSCPHEFVNAFRLEHDMSWTPETEIPKKTLELKAIGRILEANTSPGTKSIPDRVQISMKYDVDETISADMEY